MAAQHDGMSRMGRRTFLARAGVAAAGLLAGLGGPAGLGGTTGEARPPGWPQRGRGRATLILRGATVYDGTGAAGRAADVAVGEGRILAIGPSLDAAGAEVVDLNGLALAPGFIDIHSHTDLSLLVDPRAESKLRQGCTTEVSGQDGGSIGPWSDERFEGVRDSYRERYGVDIDFRDPGGFLDRIDRERVAVNVATMVGMGTVRGTVVGADDRPATDAELASMVALVRDALRRGACGVSSGLEYTPGGFATLAELAALAGPLRGTGLPYASHMRNEDDHVLAAIEEALNVGRAAGVPVQISHLKTQGERNWWKIGPVLELLEAARADGIDVLYDRYPYIAYSTGLSNLFPLWTRDGGTDAFMARLQDPALADRIEAAVRDKIAQLGSWDSVQVTGTASDALAWARGRRLGELAAERGLEPYALLLTLMLEDRGRSGMVGFGMSEENTARFLAHPLGMVCSDSGARALDGPLSGGSPHPRTYGTFPRVLGHYVRERGVMPLETAIHKMTWLPARRVGLLDRGRIAPGAAADLVAFDPAEVEDRATFEDPHRYPVGIPHVLVGGEFVLRDGERTGALPGRALRPRPR